MVNSLSYHLQKVAFDAYVTLTFGTNWTPLKTRNKLNRVFSWLRVVYGYHCSDSALMDKEWLIAEELGEVGGRYHNHLLLGSFPRRPSKSDCFAMQWIWKDSFRGGFAKIRPYTGALGGVRYVLKCLDLVDLRAVSSEAAKVRVQSLVGVGIGAVATTYAGANAFEVGKIGAQFDKGCMVTLSLGLQRRLQSGANKRRGVERSVAFFRRGLDRSRAQDKG